MRSWQHARSSAKGGRNWRDDLAIHEFLDQTKACCADRRHRLVLHHVDLGTAITEIAFPHRNDIADIVTRHVVEDLGQPVTLSDWFKHCDIERLPKPMSRRLEHGTSGVCRFISSQLDPACARDIAAVVDFLFLPARFLPAHPEQALSTLMNTSGPAIVRQVFGPPHEITGEGGTAVVDKAWIAEAVIFALYGRIPDLGEVVGHWHREPGHRA